MPLKIISLNIEKNRHLERVIPFLQTKAEEGYSLFCLQEVFKKELPLLQERLGCSVSFFPTCKYMGVRWEFKDQEQAQEQGFALMYKDSPQYLEQFCYHKDEQQLPEHTDDHVMIHTGLIIAKYEVDNQAYTIATTHFPVAPGGGTNKRQKDSLEVMLHRLDSFEDLILCGDFNAPRGKEVFSKLASIYKDNIPKEITTTIDGKFHRAGDLPYVVDGLFTTDHYIVSDIEIVDELSDHKAIVATIKKSNAKI